MIIPGVATQTNAYGPFGLSLGTTGADTNALKYTGRENDNNGLYYYRARYYDAFAGRFLSEDPIGFQAGINFYAYVNNNPVNFNDPTGNLAFLALVPPILKAIGIGATVSVGTGAVIRGGIASATGGDVFNAVTDPGSIAFDASLGAVTGPFTLGAKAFQISRLPSVAKGDLGEAFVRNSFTSQGLNFAEQVTVRAGGAKPRLDFVVNQGDNLAAFEVKTFSAGLSGPQTTLFTAIDNGGFGIATGVNASAGFLNKPVTAFNQIRLGATDFVTAGNIALGSGLASGTVNAASGGFVLYPSKINSNTMTGVYSK